MADVIWSCRECGHDLIDWWCPRCEMLHSPVTVAALDDPPEYQHPEEPLEYTDADRAYDRDAFARDYGLRDE